MKSRVLAAAILFFSAVAVCPKSYSQQPTVDVGVNTLFDLQTGLDALRYGERFYSGRPYEYGREYSSLQQLPEFNVIWDKNSIEVFLASEFMSNYMAKAIFNNEGSTGYGLSAYSLHHHHELESVDSNLSHKFEQVVNQRITQFLKTPGDISDIVSARKEFAEDIKILRAKVLEPILSYSFSVSTQSSASEVRIKSLLPVLLFVNQATGWLQTVNELQSLPRHIGDAADDRHAEQREKLTKRIKDDFYRLKQTYLGTTDGSKPGMGSELANGSDFFGAIRQMVAELKSEMSVRSEMPDLDLRAFKVDFETNFYEAFVQAVQKYKLTPTQQVMV